MPPRLMKHAFSIPPQMQQVPNPALAKSCADVSKPRDNLFYATPYSGPGAMAMLPVTGNFHGSVPGFGSSAAHPTNTEPLPQLSNFYVG